MLSGQAKSNNNKFALKARSFPKVFIFRLSIVLHVTSQNYFTQTCSQDYYSTNMTAIGKSCGHIG